MCNSRVLPELICCCEITYCHVSGVPWLIITGFGVDDSVYWSRLLKSLLITINYNNSESIYCRGLAPFSFSCLNSLTTSELTEQSQSQSHIATDGQSVSKSWCRAPFEAYDQIFSTVWQLRSCFLWGALSDERTGLSFVRVIASISKSFAIM
jgi:hypothetical protein